VKGLDDNTAAARLRRWAFDVLVRHEAEGTLPTSLRHLFYEAVMAGVIAKGDPTRQGRGRRPDQNLTDAVTWLRQHGRIPWDWIEDRTRRVVDYRGDGPTIVDGVAELLDHIRVDPWEDVLPIIAESESGAGVLVRTAERYRVSIVPTRGQSTGWLRTAVADSIGDRAVAVCYLGDYDKAGADIEANTYRVLDDVIDVKDWQRIALTWEKVEAHGLPTLPRLDHRDGQTYEVCELEALPQRLLLDAVGAYLERWLDVDLDDVHEREAGQRREIARLLGLGGSP
jgi:hypothetical protein